MSASTERLRAALPWTAATALLTLACVGQRVQDAHLCVAFAASEHRGEVPAIAWLCEEYLPKLSAWPDDLDPRRPFALRLTTEAVQFAPTSVTMPTDAVAFGSLSFDGSAHAPQVSFSCAHSGREEWFATAGFRMPSSLGHVLASIGADTLGLPRSVQVPVAVGHLAGVHVDDDPRSTLLRLAPALCGEATWLAERDGEEYYVCGRSDGGLMLPALLLCLAAIDGSGEPSGLAVRAFAARDGDRAEAVRQLGRPDRALDLDTLRALLSGEDQARLTAIDALVRQRAAGELPHIVAAADERHPLAELAAIDAIARLWPFADAATRQATRQALYASTCVRLRGIDPDAAASQPQRPGGRAPLSASTRLALALGLSALGLFWLWQRERHRLPTAPAW